MTPGTPGGASGPPGDVIIGLDVGTTAAKAVAFSPGSGWQATALREYPLSEPRAGWQVQDPDAIVAGVLGALKECIAATAGAPVTAVSVGTAMHGLIALDRHHRPLTPLVTWADARATAQAQALRESGRATELQRVTGTPVHPMSPLTKLMWFAEHDPGTCAAARWWVGLKEYVLLALTDCLVTELSSASGTGLLDLAAGDWHPDALGLASVGAEQLAEVLPTTAILSSSPAAADRTGLRPGTPVVVGAADGPLGNLGTGAMRPGTAGLNLGTSGAVRTVVDRPTTDPAGRLFCYALTADHWVTGGALSNGAHVVRWAGSALAPDLTGPDGDDEALLELAAQAPAGSDGLVMIPYLVAERAPLWDPDIPGAYLGLRRGHSRAHLVRAAVEGVATQLAVVLDVLDAVAPITTVRVTGGAFRSPLWRSTVAAALGRPVHVGSDAGGGALGAAALALYALGQSAHLEDAPALLAPPEDEPPPVEATADHVAVLADLRTRLPALVEGLGRVAAASAAGPR
ncbi:gluconokinase [Modestobacter sp. VKM Ac-2984]|uniref:gluconokinase n=1 Tax=Modestobacter sp. VKM Ac-2984 TaxID=3004138 RepID=UPI0022AAFF71|nr:gluconokinase [Modestobacter sp. VKM Ac-2984]MCZ2816338.1 gluconokinase [Modestobacter sp. VKM Ac-2984]